jgi:predicted AAA+ superfamily ATPase
MAHLRKRYIEEILKKTMGYSPIVGLLGHRQVGKTTLLEKMGSHYITLDQRDQLLSVKEDPDQFVSKNHMVGTAIDECQLAPELFPALKEYVRKSKIPGRFLLSGSVRFTSQKATRESLTGRIVNLELLPLSLSELYRFEKPRSIIQLLNTVHLHQIISQLNSELSLRKQLDKEIPLFLKTGGLPGICFVRESAIRSRKFTDQLNTILDRDLRFVYPTTILYTQLLTLTKVLSSKEGQIINYAELSQEVEIGVKTVKKLLSALESIFMLRLIPCVRGEKGFICYFEDQGESLFLDPEKKINVQLEGLIFRSIRQELFYQFGMSYCFFHYSTRGGARIPISVESNGSILGFLLVDDIHPTKAVYASANSFLKTFSNSKILLVSRNNKIELINERILHLPFCMLV